METKYHGLQVYCIAYAYQIYKGHQAKMAACLGMSIRGIRYNLKRYQIDSVVIPKKVYNIIHELFNVLGFLNISTYRKISFNENEKFNKYKRMGYTR